MLVYEKIYTVLLSMHNSPFHHTNTTKPPPPPSTLLLLVTEQLEISTAVGAHVEEVKQSNE